MLIVGTGNSQVPDAGITKSESQEAERIARSFAQNLEQTHDIKPLIDEFFAPDFIVSYVKNLRNNELFLLVVEPEVARQLSNEELLHFYIVTLNTGYLHSVNYFSKYPSTSKGDYPDDEFFPPDVARLYKKHPYSAIYKDFDAIKSVEQLRSSVDLAIKMEALLRKHVAKSRGEQSMGYRRTLKDWEVRFKLYKPSLNVCDERCFGQPKGTRIITVDIPIFQLKLAMIGDKMKIIWAAWLLH